MALQKKTTAPPVEGLNFGDLGFYSAGGGLPEGDYVWINLDVVMHEGFGEKKLAARLGVMLTLKDLNDLAAEDRKQFYSFGGKAHLSFSPNPETGKGVVAVPGGPSTSLNNSTNWAFLLRSLYDSGLPQGTFVNDLSVLEGIHVHMQNIPEPAERASFTSQTGDAAEERKPGQIAVVTEIKDDGKPWEGTGGLPEAETKKPVAKVGKPVAVPAKAKPAVAAKAAPEPEVDEDDLKTAGVAGLSSYLEANEKGGSKLAIKMAAFKHVKAEFGDEVAQAVQEGLYNDDAELGGLLEQLGFKLAGAMVKAA